MNYVTSKDYEALWNLVQEGKKIPCLYQDDGIQRAGLAQKICGEPAPPDGAFCGVGPVEETKNTFIMYCRKRQVEMLLPDEWIKINSDKDLPPEHECVLATEGSDIYKAYWDGSMWRDDMDCYRKAFMTHWKPMPEAPKE